jgi:hypothetical protein
MSTYFNFPSHVRLERLDASCVGFCLRSIQLLIALVVGLSPTLAAAGDDLNSRYRNSLLEDQRHLGLGPQTGLTTGALGQTPPGGRPTDKSLMPSFGLGGSVNEQKRDR